MLDCPDTFTRFELFGTLLLGLGNMTRHEQSGRATHHAIQEAARSPSAAWIAPTHYFPSSESRSSSERPSAASVSARALALSS
jgi:hypothetical protein